MSKHAKNPNKMGHPIPLKIPVGMEERLRALSQKTNLSMADLMRLSIERGITIVETMLATPDVKAA